MAETAGRSSWIPILIMTLLFSIVIIIIAKLNNSYQGMVMFDYSQQIVGKFFKYVIAVFYVIYYITFSVFLKLQLIAVLVPNFLPKTPNYVLLLVIVTLSGILANKGLTTVFRMFLKNWIPLPATSLLSQALRFLFSCL